MSDVEHSIHFALDYVSSAFNMVLCIEKNDDWQNATCIHDQNVARSSACHQAQSMVRDDATCNRGAHIRSAPELEIPPRVQDTEASPDRGEAVVAPRVETACGWSGDQRRRVR